MGAALGYGTQVYNNYQNGYTSTDAWTKNISAEPIVGGALLGAGAVILAPAAVAATSEALAGIAVTTGSATFMEASIATGGTATTLATAVYGASIATTTSDITVGTNILDYPSGTGFSAAYDSSTSAMEFMPSINSPTPPEGWVRQFGGHQVVADSMVAKGSKFSDLAGFAVESKLPDELNIISWNSGIINSENYGNRVKSVLSGQTTFFIGNSYEKKGTQVTKYYYACPRRLAVRRSGTLSYLLGDHLGRRPRQAVQSIP